MIGLKKSNRVLFRYDIMPSAKNIIVPIVINTGCRLKSVSRLVVLKTDIITIMVQVARSVWKIVLFSAVAFGIYLKI